MLETHAYITHSGLEYDDLPFSHVEDKHHSQ